MSKLHQAYAILLVEYKERTNTGAPMPEHPRAELAAWHVQLRAIESKRVYKDIATSLASVGWRQLPNFEDFTAAMKLVQADDELGRRCYRITYTPYPRT